MTALQKIIKGAKTLQKKNKNLSWKDAVKKSSKVYNASKKPAAKKAVRKKAVSKKVAAVPKKKIATGKAKKAVSVSYTKTIKSNSSIAGNKKVLGNHGKMYLIRDMLESEIKSICSAIDKIRLEKSGKEKTLRLRYYKKQLVVYKKQLREQNRIINQNLR